MKNIFLLLLMTLASAFAANAFDVDPNDARSQYKPYPVDSLIVPADAPRGYTPFHIEHYGRHGSRWLITDDNYNVPVRELEKAERAGVLTPLGRETLDIVRQVRDDSRGRLGELTDLGARQHRGIARRMALNYPEIFHEGTHVDARSTVVIRCILSMLNEVNQLAEMVPGMTFKTDASEADMYYMNQHDPVKNAAVDFAKASFLRPFEDAISPADGPWINRLIDDETFVNDSIDRKKLFAELYEVAINMGSHDGRYPEILTRVFTPDEINRAWQMNNASWMFNGANSSLTGHKAPRGQRNLMRNMIFSADTAIVSPRNSANLRFGHETMILSLACLMDLDGYGRDNVDLPSLADNWRAYEIFPMGCNIQIVFYRPQGDYEADDVLIRVLLNESGRKINGLTPVTGDFYRWLDFRNLLLSLTSEESGE